MRKLILKNWLSVGDIVMLTAAVRDLHHSYPDQFLTDVRTSCGALWEGNSALTPLSESDPHVEVVDCHYPLINQSNNVPLHCLNGFTQYLNEQLGLHIRPAAFKGDIRLTPLEKTWRPQVQELAGCPIPFWIIVAGGKFDCTIKWWDSRRYQEVVDHFRGRIQFVQVGEAGHHHPRLRGVIDLRGRTDLRQLVRLVYHAQGVLCGVTGLMHLAAAVEPGPGQPPNRPCVVVAGGREPPHWEAYPQHQFIHKVGALPCCAHGGCWKTRTVALGDGEPHDAPEHLCMDLAGHLPRCMDMIGADEVVRRIESYFDGGLLRYLAPIHSGAAQRAIRASRAASHPFERGVNWLNARRRLKTFVKSIPAPPSKLAGRGLVFCGWGASLVERSLKLLGQLREDGCHLPAQLWLPGADGASFAAELKALHAEVVNPSRAGGRNPEPLRTPWTLRAHAVLHCGFRQACLLNVPPTIPTGRSSNATRVNLLKPLPKTGALFWPGLKTIPPTPSAQRLCAVPDEPWKEFDPERMILDVALCWQPLQLWRWFNEHPHFFHHLADGEMGSLQLAFRCLRQPFTLAARQGRTSAKQ